MEMIRHQGACEQGESHLVPQSPQFRQHHLRRLTVPEYRLPVPRGGGDEVRLVAYQRMTPGPHQALRPGWKPGLRVLRLFFVLMSGPGQAKAWPSEFMHQGNPRGPMVL